MRLIILIVTKKVANDFDTFVSANQRRFALPTVTLTGKIRDMERYNYEVIL